MVHLKLIEFLFNLYPGTYPCVNHHRNNDVARLKEEVEHSKRIIHELRSELHTITLRAQTTAESTGRLDAKVVQLNHELDHERALVNRLKDEQLGKNDFHGSTTSTSQYTNLPHIFLTSSSNLFLKSLPQIFHCSSHLPHIFLTSSLNLPRIFCLRSTDKSTSLTKLQSTVHTLEAERDMLHVRITGLVSATDQVSERRILKQFNHSTCCAS